jgi:sugar lactone lactonase YvrE
MKAQGKSAGPPKILVDSALGRPLDTPIDVVVHVNGTMYFTNRVSANTPLGTRLASGVYRVDPAGVVSAVSGSSFNLVTGAGALALSPDGKKLYVRPGAVWDLDDQGIPAAAPTPGVGGLLGGLGIDCAGNLYLGGEGTILSPALVNIGQARPLQDYAFGGNDGMTLLMVGNSTIAVAPVNIPGLP